ncbi:hypothetical protein E1267_42845 [Nonomuraea longispora]|uniref:Uncharacterized protein n=1 Tax=Nonomuraea longispora TaxID=1848320 RepID=A0A4R4MFD9_9ACTN|nr:MULTISPECIES: hypothetical protein [Nonomuraea]NBE94581.1 hypothetical protein [Nonomuraea sp. K271]TDB94334.1 hypothetical protein E1267_42845 [Nonomuraea longispora]
MRLSRRRAQREEPAPTREPERLPQRWVLILITASLGGLTVGGLSGWVGAGVATALGLVGLLHRIMN